MFPWLTRCTFRYLKHRSELLKRFGQKCLHTSRHTRHWSLFVVVHPQHHSTNLEGWIPTSGETFCESAGRTDRGITYFCWYRGGFIWRYRHTHTHIYIYIYTIWFTRPSPHHRLSRQGYIATFVLQVSLASFLGVFMIFGLGFTSFFRMHELWRRSRPGVLALSDRNGSYGEVAVAMFLGWMIHPGNINGWNLQPSPIFCKENDLNHTPMIMFQPLIFQGVVISHDLSFNEGIIWDSDFHWIHDPTLVAVCVQMYICMWKEHYWLLATCNQL